MNTPLYKHDCNHCEFKGNITAQVDNTRNKCDVYQCGSDVIIRLSDEGHDYMCTHINHLEISDRDYHKKASTLINS